MLSLWGGVCHVWGGVCHVFFLFLNSRPSRGADGDELGVLVNTLCSRQTETRLTKINPKRGNSFPLVANANANPAYASRRDDQTGASRQSTVQFTATKETNILTVTASLSEDVDK